MRQVPPRQQPPGQVPLGQVSSRLSKAFQRTCFRGRSYEAETSEAGAGAFKASRQVPHEAGASEAGASRGRCL